jgi:hypothetical protein
MDAIPSFLGRFPFITSHYQWYLPLMPLATERHRLNDFDVIISSTSAFAKGVITSPEAPLGAALWGLTQDTTGQYSLEGGRSFDFTVLGVDQEVIRRLFAETPVTTD